MIDFSKLNSPDQLSTKIKELAIKFISFEGIGKRYLLGRNEHSLALSHVIEIDGFVDDFSESNTFWNGKPVFKGAELPQKAIIVNCSMSIRPLTAHQSIVNLGLDILKYSDLYKISPSLIPLPKFVLETQEDYALNFLKIEHLRSILFDDESKQVLDDIYNFRLTGDYSYMNRFSYKPTEQYFEEFVGLYENEFFVDAGAFDGDTSEIFCIKHPKYKKVILFEPSIINIEKAKSRLCKYKNVEFKQLGISDKKDILYFNENGGSANNISETGTTKINVTTLDEEINSVVTFIKMDLEGWEMKALEGSKQHILKDYPKMAIAVYHNPSDFWRILEYVFSIRNDYNIFLRHYTEGWSETVMYFVPKIRN